MHDRTELAFQDQEASVQTNLPLPKQQEVYYWEVKMFEKSPNTVISVGVSTKPYPVTRLPGKKRTKISSCDQSEPISFVYLCGEGVDRVDRVDEGCARSIDAREGATG